MAKPWTGGPKIARVVIFEKNYISMRNVAQIMNKTLEWILLMKWEPEC